MRSCQGIEQTFAVVFGTGVTVAAIAYPIPTPAPESWPWPPEREWEPVRPVAPPRRRTAPTTPAARRRRARTRARRLRAVLLLGAVSLGVTAVAGSSGRHPAASGPAGGRGTVIVARPGDTLWSIATRARPGSDVRPLVARLQAELGDHPLRAGDAVVLPHGD